MTPASARRAAEEGQAHQGRGGDREALADGRRGVARAPKQSVSARTISGMPGISAMPPALSEMGP